MKKNLLLKNAWGIIDKYGMLIAVGDERSILEANVLRMGIYGAKSVEVKITCDLTKINTKNNEVI